MEFEENYAKDFFVKKSSALPKNFKKRKTKWGGEKLYMITVGADPGRNVPFLLSARPSARDENEI